MAVKKFTFLFTLADGTTHRIPIEIPVGEPGGYYIPSLKQLSDNEIEVSYVPSNPDMPSVDPVTITISIGGGSGGNVELDTTLKEEGKAADAKAVGDALNGKLSSSELPTAINTALAHAKASGEFDGAVGQPGTSVTVKSVSESTADGGSNVVTFSDGKTLTVKNGKTGAAGKDGEDYVLTPADKTEIAEMAAELVDVPESSGGGIAVTGATVGQTVKISAVDGNGVPTAWEPVNFPSGGGGSGETWKKFLTMVTQEDLATIELNRDDNGNAFAYDEIHVFAKFLATDQNTAEGEVEVSCYVNNTRQNLHYIMLPSAKRKSGEIVHYIRLEASDMPYGSAAVLMDAGGITCKTGGARTNGKLTAIRFWAQYIGAGTTFVCYGKNRS